MERERSKSDKVSWSGNIVAVQPRIRLLRSFDIRHHNYLGYNLRIAGICGGNESEFSVAIGKAAHLKHQFRAGMEVSGLAVPVADSRLEVAEFYKVSGLKVKQGALDGPTAEPPYSGVPPELDIYRSRGHRRLAARTYDTSCTTCIWGCRMAVEMIIDHWNPSQKRYRFETFCYGPKSCAYYRPGAKRKVPGRHGTSYTEEDWVDEEATAHREPDE
jgi:hypothetical protein